MRGGTTIAGVAGLVLLVCGGCKQPRAADGDIEESVRAEPVSFSEAIRLAGEHQRDFVPVAAGAPEPEGGTYQVALYSRGRVKEVAVDPRTGEVTEVRERSVREGSEDFARNLEGELPSTKIDLARAVDVAIETASGKPAHPIGAQIDLEGGRLIYTITLGIAGDAREIAVDGRTGAAIDIGPVRGEGAENGVVENGAAEFSFDDLPPGMLPQGWRVDGTRQDGPLATWQIAADATAPSKGSVLALVRTNHDSTGTFNLCWTDRVRFQDGSIEVSMKPVSGIEDQGGGLIWRAQGPDDYYVCRANPLEENFRLYAVQGGHRTELASAAARISAGAWHRIRVEHEGEHIRCHLDGEKLLDTIDATFTGAGGVGFWTKADAVTSFDDLEIKIPKADRDANDPSDEMEGLPEDEDER